MRERLIEMIQNAVGGCARNWAEVIADALIANGVILLPVKVGADIYRIGSTGKIYGDWQVTCLQVYEDEILCIDDSDNYFYASDIGKTVFLSKEEAEAALKGGAEK